MKTKITAFTLLMATLCSPALAGNVYIGPTLLVEQTSANHSSFRGLYPRMSLGYAHMIDTVYLAGELVATPFTLTLSDIKNPGATSTRTSGGIGIALILGKKIYKEVLGYLRHGYISSKFSSPGTSKLGIQFGLGLQTELYQNWAVRGEYNYTTYGSVAHNIGNVSSNELGVGVIYRFE